MAPTQKRRKDESEDETSNQEVESPARSHATPKRQRLNRDVETSSENGDNEYNYAEEDTVMYSMTQSIQKRAKAVSQNEPAAGGIVMAVVCENFMCHRFLEIKFGPFMNFVIGHNGSGKSAILTAMTLCLGGKAASTNRGSSMKSFIKEGEDTARITVKLKNGGEGFRPDQYGDIIAIERNFSRDGGSNYKLKSKQGRTISTKREELDNICDFYGLQVDNPMTILTQDMARAFLNNSTNAQKYKFFNQGVQLEQLDQDYSLINTAIKNTEQVLLSKKEVIAELKERTNQSRLKVKQYESHDGLRQKLVEMQLQMAWVQVREVERLLEKKDNEIKTIRNKITKAEAEREDASTKFEQINSEFEAAEQEVKLQEEQLSPFEEQKALTKEKFDKNRLELQEIQRDEREIKGAIDKSKRKIKDYENSIQAEIQRLEQQNGGSSTRLKEEKAEVEAERDRLITQISVLDEQNIADKQAYQDAVDQLRQAKARQDAKQSELEGAKELLHKLRQADRNVMGAFDPKTQNLLAEIERQRNKFKELPVGPLGLHVTLRDPKWMSIVERFFGSTLTAFVVTNHADGSLLKSMMDNLRLRHPVLVTPPRQFNIKEPDLKFNTIYRILDISNDAARRQLIIGHGAEQAILIEDLDEANHLMADRRPEDNIAQCYSLNAHKPGFGHRVGGSHGAMSVTPVGRWESMSRMKTMGTAQIDAVANDINRYEKEFQQLRSDFRDAEQEVTARDTAVRNYKRIRRQLDVNRSRQEELMEELDAKIEEMAADGRLGSLEHQLKLENDTLHVNSQQYQDFLRNRDNLNNAQDEHARETQDIDQALALARRALEQAEKAKDQVGRRRQQILMNKNHYFSKLAEYNQILAKHEEHRETVLATVKDYSEKALHICPRVDIPDNETAESLDRKLRKFGNELKAAENALGGSKEEVVQALVKAADEYSTAKRTQETYSVLLQEENKVLSERKKRWRLFQKFISARARAQFTYMMSERAFKGRLRLEHTERPPQLIIEVQPAGEASGNRGPKTLSGGEKSFSTICLLLSLWEAMGSPIRCLDEFDVYMDSVNRSISVEMMIKTAERSIGKQFILITPQNMNQAATTQCKIIRMQDPERNGSSQRRLTGN